MSGPGPNQGAALRFAALFGVATFVLATNSVLSRSPSLRLDVVAPIVVFLSLELELFVGLIAAFGVGYLADLFSGEPKGLYWASTVIQFLLLRLFVFRIVGSRPPIVAAIVVATTVLGLVVRLLMQATLGPGRSTVTSMSPGLLSLFLGAVLLGYPLYALFSRVDAKLKPRDEQFF